MSLIEIRTDQGTSIDSVLDQLDRYSDSIEGKNELHCGLSMCNSAMREAANLIRKLTQLYYLRLSIGSAAKKRKRANRKRRKAVKRKPIKKRRPR